MPISKRLGAPLIVTFGLIMAAMTFAGPASAADNGYTSPITGAQVLGVSASTGTTASAPLQVAGVTASAPTSTSSGLAFTGTNAIGIGALGGLLLVGGGAMVFAGRRRKDNA
jgi:LPXTG-motif cell wall-anchored protein